MMPLLRRPRPLAKDLTPPKSELTVAVGDALVGYRIVRELGSGSSSTAFLGHPLRAQDTAPTPAAVLKVFRPGTEPQRVQNELAALGGVDSPHIVRLIDLGSAPDGMPVLVLERLDGGSLAQVLARRGSIEAGEAVTVLAPIGEVVARLHAQGICHGELGSQSIMFRGSGAPVLIGFGQARFARGSGERASAEWHEALASDIAGYVRLVEGVLSAVDAPGPRIDAFRRWLVECDPREQAPGFTATVAERIFALAPARPLRIALAEAIEGAAVPLRLASSSQSSATESRELEGTDVRGASLWRRGAHLPSWVGDSLEDALESAPIRALGGRLKKRLGTVRRPVWIAGGSVGLTILVLGAVLPPAQPQNVSAPELIAATTDPVSALPVETAINGDDPVAAAAVLLETRTRCLREMSVLCLDAVFQQGSVALSDERHRVRSARDGAEAETDVELDFSQMTVIERLGDTALLGFGEGPETQPASLLLMKGEAGWRIREILDD